MGCFNNSIRDRRVFPIPSHVRDYLMHIEIYSREGCAYCDAALDLAQKLCDDAWFGHLPDNGIHTYDKHTLNQDFTRTTMKLHFPQATTYPQILVDGEHVGGYTEFRQYVHDKFYARNSL